MWLEGAWKQAEQGLHRSIGALNIAARIKLTLAGSQLCRCPSSTLFSSHDLLALKFFGVCLPLVARYGDTLCGLQGVTWLPKCVKSAWVSWFLKNDVYNNIRNGNRPCPGTPFWLQL